jgi:hypothetical protein
MILSHMLSEIMDMVRKLHVLVHLRARYPILKGIVSSLRISILANCAIHWANRAVVLIIPRFISASQMDYSVVSVVEMDGNPMPTG